jgi:uncharacterized protein YjbI with pentapeptide repeats
MKDFNEKINKKNEEKMKKKLELSQNQGVRGFLRPIIERKNDTEMEVYVFHSLNFTNCDLSEIKFVKLQLNSASYTNCNFANCCFEDVTFCGGYGFKTANFTNTKFIRCHFEHCSSLDLGKNKTISIVDMDSVTRKSFIPYRVEAEKLATTSYIQECPGYNNDMSPFTSKLGGPMQRRD